jgi:hypothetical protein
MRARPRRLANGKGDDVLADALVAPKREREAGQHERPAADPPQVAHVPAGMEQPELLAASEPLAEVALAERLDVGLSGAGDLGEQGGQLGLERSQATRCELGMRLAAAVRALHEGTPERQDVGVARSATSAAKPPKPVRRSTSPRFRARPIPRRTAPSVFG